MTHTHQPEPDAACTCRDSPTLTAQIGYPVRCPHCPPGAEPVPATHWTKHVQRHHPTAVSVPVPAPTDRTRPSTCPCGTSPDPGICQVEHDGLQAGGHCTCAHTGKPACDDQTALLGRIAEAVRTVPFIYGEDSIASVSREEAGLIAAAVLPVLLDKLATNRATILRKLADGQTQLAITDDLDRNRSKAAARRELVKELRRMAAAVSQPDEEACTCAAAGDGFAPAGHYVDCPDADATP